MENWIQIGILGKPHALAGAFFVAGRDLDAPLDKTVKTIKVVPKNGADSILKKTSEKNLSGRMVLTLEGINTRDQVEELSGAALYILRSELKMKAGEFLWTDLIGTRVVDVDGKDLGIVEEVVNYGAGEIVQVRNQEKKVQLPFIDHYFDLNFRVNEGPLQLKISFVDIEEFWHA